LDKFVEQHGSSKGGDFFLGGAYSFAEVAATPFVHRASAALPVLRGYSVQKSIEQQKLTRLGAWVKASCISLPRLYLPLPPSKPPLSTHNVTSSYTGLAQSFMFLSAALNLMWRLQSSIQCVCIIGSALMPGASMTASRSHSDSCHVHHLLM